MWVEDLISLKASTKIIIEFESISGADSNYPSELPSPTQTKAHSSRIFDRTLIVVERKFRRQIILLITILIAILTLHPFFHFKSPMF